MAKETENAKMTNKLTKKLVLGGNLGQTEEFLMVKKFSGTNPKLSGRKKIAKIENAKKKRKGKWVCLSPLHVVSKNSGGSFGACGNGSAGV